MNVNAMGEKFEAISIFDKPALFTNERIDRDTVPEGWHCYDLRGSDNDPDRPIYVKAHVGVNHAGTILAPEPIKMQKDKDWRRIRNGLNFLGESMTITQFCAEQRIPQPTRKYMLRPASPDEAGLFYAQTPEKNAEMGAIGHVRIDFGKSGSEFWHTWWSRGPEELNSPAFKEELDRMVEQLRGSVLKDRQSMRRYCAEHGGAIDGGWRKSYGYIAETERYRFCLRCIPRQGDYNAYLTCYDKRVQEMVQKPLVGRITYANGDVQEFTDPKAYIAAVKEELPLKPTTGMTFETLTDAPEVQKAIDDIIFDLYGEENPRPLADYGQRPDQGMTMGGM